MNVMREQRRWSIVAVVVAIISSIGIMIINGNETKLSASPENNAEAVTEPAAHEKYGADLSIKHALENKLADAYSEGIELCLARERDNGYEVVVHLTEPFDGQSFGSACDTFVGILRDKAENGIEISKLHVILILNGDVFLNWQTDDLVNGILADFSSDEFSQISIDELRERGHEGKTTVRIWNKS